MAFPAYVPTRAVTLPGAGSIEDAGAGLRVSLHIASSHALRWAATGYDLERTGVARSSTPGGAITVELPRTDVDGWQDAVTGDYIDVSAPGAFTHEYTATIRYGNGRSIEIGPFTLPAGDDPVDLTGLLPVGSTRGDQVLVPDQWSAQLAASGEQSSSGFLRLAGTVPGNVPVVKPNGDGRAGVWEMTHNDAIGYLFHLLAGANMGHAAALVALGVDNDGIGLLIPNKDKGRAIVGDQRATVVAADAYWMHVTQRSTAAPLVRLEQQAAGVAPLIQLLNFTGTSGKLLQVVNADGEVGSIDGAGGSLGWLRDIRISDRADATASYLRLDSGAGASSSTMKVSYHGDDEDVFFGATGTAGAYYPYRIAHSASTFAIQTAANVTGKGTAPTPADVTTWNNRITASEANGVTLSGGMVRTNTNTLGFYGAAAITKPVVTGSLGGNAAAASIVSALAALGLVTNSTTA